MSRNSDAKKARRKKRQVSRNARWFPEQQPQPEEDHDPELVEAVSTFEEWITARGWTFDLDFSTRGLASWYYEPSAAESEDDQVDEQANEQAEVVTRVWFTVGEYRDEDFPNRVSAALVGSGGGEGATYSISPDQLIDHIEAIEAYRPGDPVPVLS